MKYNIEIEINKPRQVVVDLMNDEKNLKEWIPGLIKFERLTGEPGANGSTNRFTSQWGKKEMVMIETIIDNSFPDHFKISYDAPGMKNFIQHNFIEVNENTTKIVSENEFIPSTFFLKLFTTIMPFAFKKQSMVYLKKFKEFCERS